MSVIKNKKNTQNFLQNDRKNSFIHLLFVSVFLSGIWLFSNPVVKAQSPVSGGFAGQVLDKSSKTPLPGATVRFTNQTNGFKTAKRSDESGYFRQDTLQPGVYEIIVTLEGYKTATTIQELYATRSNQIVPVPVELEKETVAVNPTPSPGASTTSNVGLVKVAKSDTDSGASLNPRRDAAFNERDVRTLPLGGTTLTRSFDELALLAPGVAPPPQAIGNSVGPGVGGGVGTSGQFAVNGLRSRANNFTVDGSDNNDEDIGVRRQGFFALVPQPIESIQEFQIITLLAPAQFGRNLGAQVNALSKSGGNQFHGTIFGFLNNDILNARNFFDNTGGDTTLPLQARRFSTDSNLTDVFIDDVRPTLTNNTGSKDGFTLLQGGFALGGPIVQNKVFFFVSGEGQLLNANKERSFAVPTVEQRGFAGSGATGLQQCLGTLTNGNCVNQAGNRIAFAPSFPTSLLGNAIFSFFPFPNNPNGIYDRNTYTQELSADARGRILSGKVDYNFSLFGEQAQTFTARYNNTDDRRDLTDVAGALFSAIRPLVKTDNFSTYLIGGLTKNISNELRFSWGRTRLRFDEIRDETGFIQPIQSQFDNPEDARFLLNARATFNLTSPNPTLCTSTGCFAPNKIDLNTLDGGFTTEDLLGPIGQLIVAGFSPVGVDVFNFPQQRVNNTYQFADTMRWKLNQHNISFGTDIRRTLLDSNLPRNSRPLITFNGIPNLFDTCRTFQGELLRFCSGADLAALGASTGSFQTLSPAGIDSRIQLSYYQLNFFAQDEWRIAPKILLSYGLRYELNTTPDEANKKIESTFSQQLPTGIGGLSGFIAGRNKIFDTDLNNFAPRIGIAAQITRSTVIRGGYGIYYDQILGSVVSQSRNFPTFTTVNLGGASGGNFRQLLTPFTTILTASGLPIVQPGTLNTINPNLNINDFLNTILRISPASFGATLPTRKLDTPFSQQYFVGAEQQLFRNTFLSVGYVGTTGRSLLRFATPNLGINNLSFITAVNLSDTLPGTQFNFPLADGVTIGPTTNPLSNILGGRPVANAGLINQFETTGRSRYHSLQIQLRGRLTNNFQYQTNYVYGKVEDDVSDVFDLAGAYALPQNSITPSGEYAVANFDVRHRFTYNFIYDLPGFRNRGSLYRNLFGGWQVAGTGKFNTGQPFTVNSIYDVNLDGNLTDRLDNTQFITETGDRRQPLSLTCTTQTQCQSLLAPIGQDGSVPRNSFRAGSILDLDLSFIKRFALREGQNLQLRADVFNFINRANFGIPVRILEAPGFGQATDTVTPGRRIQFAVKYLF